MYIYMYVLLEWLVTEMNQIIFSKVTVELLDKNIDD